METKNCPRCTSGNVGMVSELEIFNMEPEDFGEEDIYSAVVCNDCKFQGKLSSSEEMAKSVWNMAKRKGMVEIRKTSKIAIIKEMEN